MKTRTWLALAVVAVAIVTAITLAPAVLAQGPASGDRPGPRSGRMMDATPGPGYGMGPRGHMGPTGAMHGRMGGPQQSLVAVAAEQIGLSQADLVAQLQQGKTIAQVAAEHNVALNTIVDAFVATHQARMATAIAAGHMTQEQVTTMLGAMKANVTTRLTQPWSPRGNGPAAGFVDQNGDGMCDHAGSGWMGGGPTGERWNQ